MKRDPRDRIEQANADVFERLKRISEHAFLAMEQVREKQVALFRVSEMIWQRGYEAGIRHAENVDAVREADIEDVLRKEGEGHGASRVVAAKEGGEGTES